MRGKGGTGRRMSVDRTCVPFPLTPCSYFCILHIVGATRLWRWVLPWVACLSFFSLSPRSGGVSRRRGRVHHTLHLSNPTFSCSCASFPPTRARVGVRRWSLSHAALVQWVGLWFVSTHLGRRPAHTSDAFPTACGVTSLYRPRHRALPTPHDDGFTATNAPHPARPSPDVDLVKPQDRLARRLPAEEW